MIQKAEMKDLELIYLLTKKCAANLIKKDIYQWNDYYPSLKVLQKDIELQQLWKLSFEGNLVGIIVITEIIDIEYDTVKWLTDNNANLYIHRLAVDPDYQGKGFAQKLMNFSENYAIENNYKSVRLDTFSQNKRNVQFYKKRGYHQLEDIYFLNQSEFPFHCFELVLNA